MKERSKWTEEVDFLKSIIGKTELEETTKWGGTVWVFNGQNVMSVSAFKAHVALWFFDGVYLKDKDTLLQNSQSEKTKAMRQWKFTSKEQMDENLILSYIQEAIQNAKDGKRHKPIKNQPLVIPKALNQALQEDKALGKAFERLNLTQKREFTELISTAKRETTLLARWKKIKPMILTVVGWNDNYRQ
jgi:uncharacterized protein YdeI (YjbR/CyaY-like superfamily)